MQKQISSKTIALSFGVLTLLFLTAFYVFAVWTEPSASPPGDNVPPPINEGTTPQTKNARLSATQFGDADDPTGNWVVDPYSNSYFNGNVGIGTTAPNALLEVKKNVTVAQPLLRGSHDTGNESFAVSSWASRDTELRISDDADKRISFLTSGESYINNWNYSNAGGLALGTIDAQGFGLYVEAANSGAAYFAGNVGIGTESPGAKLEIAGQIKITGGSPGTGKILTSDATGLALWTTPTAGGSLVCGSIFQGTVDSCDNICGNAGWQACVEANQGSVWHPCNQAWGNNTCRCCSVQ